MFVQFSYTVSTFVGEKCGKNLSTTIEGGLMNSFLENGLIQLEQKVLSH